MFRSHKSAFPEGGIEYTGPMTDTDISPEVDDTEDEEVVSPDEVTDEDLRTLFPNPAGYAIARMAYDAHLAYSDAHAATFPDEVNVKERAWAKPYLTSAATTVETECWHGGQAMADLLSLARTSDDATIVAEVMAYADLLKQAAKDNLRGLYLSSRNNRPVLTGAVSIEELERLLSLAETNVNVLLTLTTNGCADAQSIWSILPSSERQKRNGKAGDTSTRYAPPRIKRATVSTFRENSSKLKLAIYAPSGEFLCHAPGNIGEAVKSHLGYGMKDVATRHFDGTFTTDSIGTPFVVDNITYALVTV